jgi:hypothetical protein
MPVFNPPRRLELTLTDDDGRTRTVVAARPYGRNANLPHWNLTLSHANGDNWPGSFDGAGIIDAMGALLERKAHLHHTNARSHAMQQDRNVPVDDAGELMQPTITTYSGKPVSVSWAREAAAAGRARQERGER